MDSKLKICREIIKKSGKTYYFASKLLPKKTKEAIYILYAFFRVPDDIVDMHEDLSVEIKTKLLDEWIDKWDKCIENEGESDEAVLSESYKVHIQYKISYANAFFDSMKKDLIKGRYKNYDELETYMYGSAGVIATVVAHVVNRKNINMPLNIILGYAEKLGYAMQLTVFIRDICEDIDERNRIYMPVDECKIFEVTELDFAKHKYPEKWNDFIELQLHRAERLYREVDQGLKHLNWYGRFSIKLVARLYEAYHHEIRKSGYKVYHYKYKINLTKRILILIRTIFK
jgi:phytoene synthase